MSIAKPNEPVNLRHGVRLYSRYRKNALQCLLAAAKVRDPAGASCAAQPSRQLQALTQWY